MIGNELFGKICLFYIDVPTRVENLRKFQRKSKKIWKEFSTILTNFLKNSEKYLLAGKKF